MTRRPKARVLDPDALDVCGHDWWPMHPSAVHHARLTGPHWDQCARCGVWRRRPLLPWPPGFTP